MRDLYSLPYTCLLLFVLRKCHRDGAALLLHTAATLALAMAPDSAAPHLLLPLAYLLPFRAWSRSLEEKSPGYFNKLVGLEAPEVLW